MKKLAIYVGKLVCFIEPSANEMGVIVSDPNGAHKVAISGTEFPHIAWEDPSSPEAGPLHEQAVSQISDILRQIKSSRYYRKVLPKDTGDFTFTIVEPKE